MNGYLISMQPPTVKKHQLWMRITRISRSFASGSFSVHYLGSVTMTLKPNISLLNGYERKSVDSPELNIDIDLEIIGKMYCRGPALGTGENIVMALNS